MKKEKPDDPYVVVTEGPAWQLLDHLDILKNNYERIN
jgi:hypothetical protein